MKRTNTLLLGLLLLLAGHSPLWALGLGEARIESALDQPLRAEIPLLSISPKELLDLKVGLASPAAYSRAGIPRDGIVRDIQFTISSGLNPSILLSSQQAIREPLVVLLVEAEWPQGRLLREYTLFFDPPFASNAANDPFYTEVTETIFPATSPSPAAVIDQDILQEYSFENQIGGGTRPEVTAAQPAVAAAASSATSSANSGLNIGITTSNYLPRQVRVGAGESISEIAERLVIGTGLRRLQMVQALYEANPNAFAGNINELNSGALLQVPDYAQVAALDFNQSVAFYQRKSSETGGSVAATSSESGDASRTSNTGQISQGEVSVSQVNNKAENAQSSAATVANAADQAEAVQIVEDNAVGQTSVEGKTAERDTTAEQSVQTAEADIAEEDSLQLVPATELNPADSSVASPGASTASAEEAIVVPTTAPQLSISNASSNSQAAETEATTNSAAAVAANNSAANPDSRLLEQNSQLKGRVSELETRLAEMKTLIEIRSDEAVRLQRRLDALEANSNINNSATNAAANQTTTESAAERNTNTGITNTWVDTLRGLPSWVWLLLLLLPILLLLLWMRRRRESGVLIQPTDGGEATPAAVTTIHEVEAGAEPTQRDGDSSKAYQAGEVLSGLTVATGAVASSVYYDDAQDAETPTKTEQPISDDNLDALSEIEVEADVSVYDAADVSGISSADYSNDDNLDDSSFAVVTSNETDETETVETATAENAALDGESSAEATATDEVDELLAAAAVVAQPVDDDLGLDFNIDDYAVKPAVTNNIAEGSASSEMTASDTVDENALDFDISAYVSEAEEHAGGSIVGDTVGDTEAVTDTATTDDPLELQLHESSAQQLDEQLDHELNSEADDDDISGLSGEDELSTRLDLARAYADMGDADEARRMLEEVLASGNEAAMAEAKALLAELDV